MENSKPIVLPDIEASCEDQKDGKTNPLSIPMDVEYGGEEVEAMVRFFNRRLREDELRRQAYEELSDDDRKYISIDEIIFLDGSEDLEDDDDEGEKTGPKPGPSAGGTIEPKSGEPSYVLKYINQQPIICNGTTENM